MISHILFQPPIPLSETGIEVPEALAAVITRALAPKPADRFHDVAELANALAPFVGSGELPVPIAAESPSRSTPAARSSEIRSRDDELVVGDGHVAPVAVVAQPDETPLVQARGARPTRYLLAAVALLLAAGWWLLSAPHVPARTTSHAPARTDAIALTRHTEPTPTREQLAVRTAASVSGPAMMLAPKPAASAASLGSTASRDAPGGSPASAGGASNVPASSHPSRARPSIHHSTTATVSAPDTVAEPAVIEVRREERTIVFKLDNPLRR